jgi:hypothetical protein
MDLDTGRTRMYTENGNGQGPALEHRGCEHGLGQLNGHEQTFFSRIAPKMGYSDIIFSDIGFKRPMSDIIFDISTQLC